MIWQTKVKEDQSLLQQKQESQRMEKEDLAKEESLKRSLHKLMLFSIKIIPMIVSGIYLLNTVFSFFVIDLPILSYIVQFLFIGMMYLTSYAFKFCSLHRMFIHYIFIVFVLNIVDYHIGIPVSDKTLFLGYIILTTVCLFIALYLRFKVCRH